MLFKTKEDYKLLADSDFNLDLNSDTSDMRSGETHQHSECEDHEKSPNANSKGWLGASLSAPAGQSAVTHTVVCIILI